jgi:hypothetical protein
MIASRFDLPLPMRCVYLASLVSIPSEIAKNRSSIHEEPIRQPQNIQLRKYLFHLVNYYSDTNQTVVSLGSFPLTTSELELIRTLP